MKKSRIFAILAGCLFATYGLLGLIYYLVNFDRFTTELFLVQFLWLSSFVGMAVMLFMNKFDWVLFGFSVGGATIALFGFAVKASVETIALYGLAVNASVETFFQLIAILGVSAIIFLNMRRIEVVKFLFYGAAVFELLAFLVSGSLQAVFDRGFAGFWGFLLFLCEQFLIAGYLMLGFAILHLLVEEKRPAYAGAWNGNYAPRPMPGVQQPAWDAYPPAAPAKREDNGVKFCSYCGMKNGASDSFCGGCGSRLS